MTSLLDSRRSAVPFSAIDLINQVDTWPYFQHDPSAYRHHMQNFHYFFITGYQRPFGYIHDNFVQEMQWSQAWTISEEYRTLTLTETSFDGRTKAIQDTLRLNHEQQRVIRKLYNEDFPLRDSTGIHVLNMDGCGVDLFGVVSYGVHMTGFVKTDQGIKYWVPRRSFTKPTFPGMLDNFVAGNLNSTESPAEGMVREVFEETGISEDYTKAHMRSCGTVTYQMTVTNDGRPGCQHHCQYVFEMELDQDMTPSKHDGEVESFALLSLEEVQQALMGGEFTPNRMMTYIAHFVRHGIIEAGQEPRLQEICARLHRKHELFVV